MTTDVSPGRTASLPCRLYISHFRQNIAYQQPQRTSHYNSTLYTAFTTSRRQPETAARRTAGHLVVCLHVIEVVGHRLGIALVAVASEAVHLSIPLAAVFDMDVAVLLFGGDVAVLHLNLGGHGLPYLGWLS